MKIKFKLCTSLLVLFISACTNHQTDVVKEAALIKSQDTIIAKKINLVQKKISDNNLANIDDSLRYYIYNIFFDKRVKADSIHQAHYFCSYDLVPINFNLLDSSIVVEYELVMRNNENINEFFELQLYLLQVHYKFESDKTVFNPKKMEVLGVPYMYDRLLHHNPFEIDSFIKSNGIIANAWYLSELKKRE